MVSQSEMRITREKLISKKKCDMKCWPMTHGSKLQKFVSSDSLSEVPVRPSIMLGAFSQQKSVFVSIVEKRVPQKRLPPGEQRRHSGSSGVGPGARLTVLSPEQLPCSM